jgi:hypothetical protein
MGGDMTDQELIDYCEEHCRTPMAMFHRNHIRRMFLLADNQSLLERFDALDAPEWFSVHADAMLPLVNAARRRMREGHGQRPGRQPSVAK